MINNVLPAIFLSVTIFTVQAQTAEDYFVPEKPNNKIDYSTPGSSQTVSKYYVKKDSVYIVIDSAFAQGRVSGVETKVIQFIDNEAHLIKHGVGFGTGKLSVKECDPTQVILKVPKENKTIEWTSIDPDKGTIKYIASWKEVTHNGKKHKMLRVEKSFDHTTVKEVEYYLKATGLINQEILVGTSAMQKLNLEGLNYVPGM